MAFNVLHSPPPVLQEHKTLAPFFAEKQTGKVASLQRCIGFLPQKRRNPIRPGYRISRFHAPGSISPNRDIVA